MTPQYQRYYEYYAQRCPTCKGSKRVLKNGSWVSCYCQKVASYKCRFDQIRVHPASLKQKGWDDFTGLITDNNITTGMLDPSAAIEGKKKALAYCYKNGDYSKKENLKIHKHLGDGQNVIIGGGKRSGKTMLGYLIMKEVMRSALYNNLKITFDWVHVAELKQAARWDNNKPLDHSTLDDLAEVDFLAIDGVDYETREGHHTNPPDRTSMNMLFAQRDMYRKPTIIICTDSFINMLCPRYEQSIALQWGDEFCNLVNQSSNLVIHLKRGRKSE